jgi:hypothetical protein
MIDPDYMDEMMDWHGSMTNDQSYMEGIAESEGQATIFHEAVKTVQSRRARLVSDDQPSETDETYWLYAERQKGRYKKSNDHSGKWLIFLPPDKIDAAWEKVEKLTEDGKLGNSSKVSTKLGNQNRDFVICVYTYDWTDKKDCMAIRETLRAAGFTQPLSYKSDEDTLAGKYAGNQEAKIAKYRV